ncbi:MAG: class I SAM-dependent methyltransferase [Acidimicrobiales bacterium]|nr:class I SAM-dependent methyltransferase [Acidimicrobiales bacterium]
MTETDRLWWDARYRADDVEAGEEMLGLPALFAPFVELFPTSGNALELACGRGQTSVWLAARGLDVLGVDISAVALRRARDLATSRGVGGRCRFEVADLDSGLPPGPPADVVICHMFRDARLDQSIVDRLVVGGLLAVAALSEVGSGPGRFRVAAGELAAAFPALSVVAGGEGTGRAWLLARR